MNQLKTSLPPNSSDMTAFTYSLELASGITLYAWPDGRVTDQSGRLAARASLSARQAKALGLMTSGTCGLTPNGSSSSAALSNSLVSKLRAATQTLGSTLYTLTWKPWATPSGVSRFRLRASVRRISETALTGWPTPQARDHFPAHTPEYIAAKKAQGHGMANLNDAVTLAGWTTPSARDWKDTPGMTAQRDGKDRVDQLPRQAFLAGPARLTASGDMLTGSDAAMESGGQLDPAHSRWLMGLSQEWDDCAPTETPSMLKRQKHL